MKVTTGGQRLRSVVRAGLTALLPLVLAGRVASAQGPPVTPQGQKVPVYRLRLLGVYDQASGEPIQGAEVADVLTGTNMLTSSTGTVSLLFMPDGGGLVRIRKVGYEATTLAVSISPADTFPVTVILARAVVLPAVVTRDTAPQYRSPGLRGFEDRRAAKSGGYFISEADLRKSDGRRVGEAMRSRLPGVMFISGASGAIYLATQKNCLNLGGGGAKGICPNPRCYVMVYLDGSPIDTGSPRGAHTDFNRLDVEQFGGIEFYSDGASVPPQYNVTGSDCGLLMLWTRER